MSAIKSQGSGSTSAQDEASEWPVNLRTNRTEVITFLDGVPPGGSITIDTDQQPRGKRIRLTFAGRASIKHRKKGRKR